MAAAYKLPLSSLQSLCQGLERSGVFLRVVLTGGGGGNFPWQIGPAGRVGDVVLVQLSPKDKTGVIFPVEADFLNNTAPKVAALFAVESAVDRLEGA